MVRSRFGTLMTKSRQATGLYAHQLAAMIGCETGMLERVEMGLQPVPGRYLIAWASALRMSPEAIILMWVNEEARKMCLEAGIGALFKIVPAEAELYETTDTPGRTTYPGRSTHVVG